MPSKILILANRNAHNAPRILREIEFFSDTYEIHLCAKTKPEKFEEGFTQVDWLAPLFIEKLFRKLFYFISFRNIFLGKLWFVNVKFNQLLKTVKPDIIIIHEPEWLPYVATGKKHYKLVFNAHEYHPLEFNDNAIWLKTYGKYYYKLYERFLKYIDLFVNVCDSIRDKCITEFGADSIVVPNAASYYSPGADQHQHLSTKIRIIHHGGAMPERKIEEMIWAMKGLEDRFQLDLMLVRGDNNYYEFIEEIVSEISCVRLIPPVDFNYIISTLTAYDIGLFNLPINNYNYEVALPNKLFEFVQARLCLVVSPNREMEKMVKKYNLGYITNGFTHKELHQTLLQIDKNALALYKLNSEKAAVELCAENFMKFYLQKVNNI